MQNPDTRSFFNARYVGAEMQDALDSLEQCASFFTPASAD